MRTDIKAFSIVVFSLFLLLFPLFAESDWESYLNLHKDLVEILNKSVLSLESIRDGKENDPSENELSRAKLLQEMEAHNPSLIAASARTRAADADLKAAQALRLPKLQAEFGTALTANPIGPISLSRGELGSIETGTGPLLLPPDDILLYKGMEETWYNFALKAELPLFTWGKIKKGIGLQEQALTISKLQALTEKKELRAQILAAIDALLCLREARKILDLQIKISQRMLHIAGESEKAGFLTRSELARTRVRFKELEIESFKLDDKIANLLDLIAESANFTGLKLEDFADLTLSPGKIKNDIDESLLNLLENSPQIALTEELSALRLEALNVAKIEARGLPDIGLETELSYGGPRFPLLEKDWYRKDDWQLSIRIGSSGSIFGSASAKAQMERARAELAEAEAISRATRRKLESWHKERYLSLALYREKIDWAVLDQEVHNGELERIDLEYKSGSGTELAALQALLEALTSLATAWGDIALYYGEVHSLEAIY